jgi:hypothetical protein
MGWRGGLSQKMTLDDTGGAGVSESSKSDDIIYKQHLVSFL